MSPSTVPNGAAGSVSGEGPLPTAYLRSIKRGQVQADAISGPAPTRFTGQTIIAVRVSLTVAATPFSMPEQQPVSTPSLQTRFKWALFRVLEWAANLRAGQLSATSRTPRTPTAPPGSGEGWLWVFVSTIGEVNAIEPFLRAFLAESGNPPLVLFSDHEHYRA